MNGRLCTTRQSTRLEVALNNGLAITSISNNLLEWESTAITNIGTTLLTLKKPSDV